MFKFNIGFFFLALFFLGLVLTPPQNVFGAELKYAKILDVRNREVLIQFGGLETPRNYLCNTFSLSCQNLGASTPQEISSYFDEKETPLSEQIGDIQFDRNKATRITLSLHQKFLAYYEPATLGKSTTQTHVLLDLKTNPPKKYSLSAETSYWDLLTEELRLFDFSPNEKRLLYLDDKDNYPTLYLVNLNPLSKKPLPGTKLFSKNYSVADFQFLDDDNIVFVANRDNIYRFSLYKFNIPTKKLTKIADDISYGQRVKKEGSNLIFLQIINNSVVPVLYNTSSGKLKYFKDIPANPPKDKAVVSELFSTGNLHGVILRSSKFAKSAKQPLLIWLHGGPYREASWLYHPYLSYAVYDWMLNDLVKSGVTVLKLDYRGSYGFGRTFAESITKNVGKGDVADVLAAQKAMKLKYPISQTYLSGNSYGGYLALRTIVEEPKSFGGALSINGVTAWDVLLNKLENSIFNVQFGGTLQEKNGNLFYQAAIDERIKNLTNQKIIIAQASADNTVPPSQADYLFNELKKKGKDQNIELIKYPKEDHVFHKKSSLISLCQKTYELVGKKPDAKNCLFD